MIYFFKYSTYSEPTSASSEIVKIIFPRLANASYSVVMFYYYMIYNIWNILSILRHKLFHFENPPSDTVGCYSPMYFF